MRTIRSGAACAAAVALLAVAGAAPAATIVGLTTDQRLLTFDHLAPGVLFSNVAVSGLGMGESLVGIDLRPATGQVIGVTQSGIYDLNFTTGAATLIGGGFGGSPLNASADSSIDFNPTVDRIRVVDTASGNRRLNPTNGTAVLPVDTALTYAGSGGPVRAAGVAYTNSLATATPGTARQFIIDSATDMLVETGSLAGGNASFNAGVVSPIGSLGFDIGDNLGFDIFGPTGVAVISTTAPGGLVSSLRVLNLGDASSMFIGDIAGGTIRDITIIPAPGAIGIAGLAGLCVIRRRR